MKPASLLSALLSLAATHATAATLTNSWTFEAPDSFNDKTGTAHGTGGALITTTAGYNGGTAMAAPATVGSASGYVDLNETGITSMLNTGFSVTYWFRMADDGAALNRGFFDFSGNGGDTGLQGIHRGSTDNALNFRIDGSGTPNAVLAYVPPTSAEDDRWHHIALTFERNLADGFKLYFDGALVSSASTTTFLTSTTVGPNASSYLGSFNFAGTSEVKGLNGALDDFGIWSGVLTAGEVSALAVVPEPGSALFAILAMSGLITVRRR